eukprot:CAMPEP_0170817246 /NCGR_PEP_ID=MMETSP0733-20121128/39896_1 /TAXON_ID=186038 /ORGANISM="Fragilariopsis kerguelensis, Strain L26-C5" /LENGTH=277 /DNA_ID=CAMNT_0011176871 /DNA_START=81 /DNA_END=914 /DNA_ORIENTATION=+
MAIHRGRSMMILPILIIVASMIVYSSAFGVGGLGQGSSAKNCPLFSKSASSSLSKRITSSSTGSSTSLPMAAVVSGNKKKKVPYKPKWVKKQTLAESGGNVATLGEYNVGLKGAIPVLFKQGNETITTKAWAGQPIRDVASQAGQYIQYGCGKGECGTCECMMNGKWIRPCVEAVPATDTTNGAQLVLTIKAGTAKKTNSGTFFSIKSFLMGFWNNILGMLGFVKFRKKADANWNERKEYETLIAQKTLEKKLLRQQQELQKLNGNGNGGGTTPGMA